MSHDDWPDWLPGDWSVHIRKVDGRKVKCYVDPDGHKCYSKPQVFDYLKKTNKSLPADKPQNGEGPAIDLSAEPNAPHTDEGPDSTPGGPPTKLTPRSNRRKSISTDLSEDFLGGDGSSSEPSSHKRHRGDCNWLPEGWTVEDKVRQGGSTSGIKYKVYIDPVSGQNFFSKPQVLNHIAKTNSSAGVQEAEPSSHKRHRGDCNWLPEGWTVEDKVRQGGSSSGIKYKVYINPVSGQKFFSKPQVLNHIAKTNSSAGVQEAVFAEPISAMLISSWQEKPTTEPDNSQMYEATEAEKKTEDKTEISRLSSDDEVVTRTPAEEGLPPGGSFSTPESLSMGSEMTNAFSEINKRLQDIHELVTKCMEENREVTEIMRDRQWAHDFEFYSKPHDHLTGKALKMALAQKELIEKKYNL